MKKLLAIFFIAMTPSLSLACSCGSSLLDVGSGSSLLPTAKGGLLFAQYDNVDQSGKATHTKQTDSYTVGGQYLFNRKWGIAARVPYVMREEFHSSDNMAKNSSIGDIKLTGIYSGLNKDMSSGIIFGAKLPTGATKQAGFGRDTQIGTGSYDLILGFYNFGQFSQSNLGWLAQATWQKPLIFDKAYRTGDELSASIGGFYNLGEVSSFSRVAPLFQFIATNKKRETGFEASTTNGGYRRLFIAPGVEVVVGKFKLYADIEMPIYADNGGQLAVEKIFKFVVGYKF